MAADHGRSSHGRIPAVARVLLAVTPLAFSSGSASPPPQEREGTVAVRFVEGTLHGFLRLTDSAGKPIADGELLQVPRRGGLDSRMIFRFRDKSYFEERVLFTQRGVFRMQSYSLVQRGPAFPDDIEVNLQRSGKYEVKATSHDDGESKSWSGTMDLPADTYNGMIVTIAKNLVRGDTQRVHIVAFTPKPRMISLEIAPSGTSPLRTGTHPGKAVHFVLKPKLGAIIGLFARLTGKMPPDSHAWIVTDGAPGFVRFRGPLYTGPVWQLELAAPSWPD